MKRAEYLKALSALDLTQVGASAVLGVSPRTAQNYAANGPPPPAALAIRLLLLMSEGARERVIEQERRRNS
jgi:hypothetical protein